MPTGFARLLVCSLLFLLALLGLSFAQQRPKATPTPLPKISSHVILIVVSGLGADLLNSARQQLPTLQSALQANGASAVSVEGVYPSLAQPAQATLATGMLPADHGVFADEGSTEPAASDKSKNAFVWESATRGGLKVAAIGYALTRGAALQFNQPDVPGQPPIAETKQPHADALKRDEQRVLKACEWIETARPNLLLITFDSLALAQRRFGLASKEVSATLQSLDAWLGQLLAASERAQTHAGTTFLLVSDHGLARVENAFNPNAVLAKKGWLTLDAQGQVAEWKARAQLLGGAAAIYVKNPNEEKAVEALFREIHQKPDSPLWRIVNRQELSRLGSNPQAAFFLDAAPGYVMGAKTNVRAAAGYLPQRVEMRPVFIVFGNGIKAGAKLEYARLTDVAPTIARLLGFTQPASRGRVLSELFQQ